MRETVLVTGAGGFIGGRVVEVLHASGQVQVRAGVRRWSTAARIGRLPVDIVACDLLDAAQVDAAMTGASAVVHCAVGGHEATVQGTRNVLDAALRHGVRRVVHLSTIDVYGGADGVVTEDSALVATGAAYGDAKIEAEQACMEYGRQGGSVVILRPTIVYGPFSESWTVEFARRMTGGRWLLPEADCLGRCNLVYVDDLVQAVVLGLDAAGVDGQAFNINGPDDVTWHEYFHGMNQSLGPAAAARCCPGCVPGRRDAADARAQGGQVRASTLPGPHHVAVPAIRGGEAGHARGGARDPADAHDG
jgi:nucleoside-diphosphate-sugar epimerase